MSGLGKHLVSVTLLIFSTATFSRADWSVTSDSENGTISCYQCHSKYDEDCIYLLVNASRFYKPCVDSVKYEGLKPFCRKIVQKIHAGENKDVVVRRCGWVLDSRNCYRVRNWDHSERVCQCFTDGCNDGATLHGSILLLIITLFWPVTLIVF